MTLVLASSEITAQVCPTEGGRVSSLRCNASGTEFLTQARPNRAAVVPGFEAQFADGPCAGIEDCLPTVGACGAGTEGGQVPDHGDFWQLPWTVLEQTGAMVRMNARGFSRSLQLRKELQVIGRSLQMRYQVTNHGAAPTSLLYAAHPLLAITQEDRIVLPEEVRELNVTYARGSLLDAQAPLIRWPIAEVRGSALDLSVTGPGDDGAATMLYSRRLRHGACGLYRTCEQQGVAVRFSPDQLPYLGVWLCYGGWPEAGEGPKQYAVALEPTLAPCNRLDQAQQMGLALHLEPGCSAAWWIDFAVTPPGLAFESFARDVQSPLARQLHL